jgi:ribosome-binding factor A
MRKRQGASNRSPRQLRVGEELRHALVRILARGELHDPLLADAQVTVTEVRVSPDLRAATAFITPFGGGDSTALVKALNHAGGYFRGQIAHEVDLRMAPTIRFAADTSFAQSTRIEELLHDPRVARDLEPETAPKPGRRKGPSGDGA